MDLYPPRPLSFQVVYTGRFRDIKSNYIQYYKKALGADNPAVFDLYHQEVLVKQKGKSYWIPIQDPLVKPIKDELRPGQTCRIFVRWLGWDRSRAVYMMVEFEP